MSYQFSLEDLGQSSSGSSQFKFFTPPISVEGDTTTITGFVKGIQISDWSYDSQKNQVIITFTNEEGANIRKYVQNPEHIKFIQDMEDEEKKEAAAKQRFEDLIRIARAFTTDESMRSIFQSKFDFETLSNGLSPLVVNKFDPDLLLKVVFKDSEGVDYPKYVVGNSYYIGKNTDKYKAVKFIQQGNQWDDKITFKKIEKQPDDFSNNISYNADELDLSGL